MDKKLHHKKIELLCVTAKRLIGFLILCYLGILPLNADQAELENTEIDHKSIAEAATVTIQSNTSTRGAGATGFITEIKGKKYVVTNIHVLHGEAKGEIELLWTQGPNDSVTLSGRNPQKSRLKTSYEDFQKYVMAVPMFKVHGQNGELKTGEALVLSEKSDVAFIPVETDIPGLKFSSQPPSRGEQVFVIGNPGAEHTLIVCDGTIKSIGPDRIEIENIDGGLKEGMSGGPVISRKTGQVLGLVAYKVVEAQMDENFDVTTIDIVELRARIMRRSGRFSERNFAFRVDEKSDLDLAAISWKQFLVDCATLEAMIHRTLNIAIASDVYMRRDDASGYIKPIDIGPDFDYAVQMTYSSSSKQIASTNGVDNLKAWDSYQNTLESLNNQDFSNPKHQIKTAYLKNIAREGIAPFRADVSQKLRAKSGKLR